MFALHEALLLHSYFFIAWFIQVMEYSSTRAMLEGNLFFIAEHVTVEIYTELYSEPFQTM